MYSMSNEEQLQEGAENDANCVEWEYTDDSDEDEDSSSGEEVDSPPRSKCRSK